MVMTVRRQRSGRPHRSVAALLAIVGLVFVSVLATGRGDAALRWRVSRSEADLDRAVASLVSAPSEPVKSEARDAPAQWVQKAVAPPAAAGGFVFHDATLVSDGSGVWLDLTVEEIQDVMRSQCRGLTYAIEGTPHGPIGMARAGVHDEWQPAELGSYQYLSGNWYWHSWTCNSL